MGDNFKSGRRASKKFDSHFLRVRMEYFIQSNALKILSDPNFAAGQLRNAKTTFLQNVKDNPTDILNYPV